MDRLVFFENCRGQKLAGVLHVPDQETIRAGVVLCHGMESNKSSAKIVAMSKVLRDRGLAALRFDFTGAGESGGDFAEISYSRQVEDLRAAVAYLVGTGAEHVGLIGSSMGGSVAWLYAGTEMRVAGLATIAAPSDPLEVVRQVSTQADLDSWEEIGFTQYHGRRINRSFLDDVRQLDILSAVSRITCPVLLIHGDADQTVPVDQAHRVYAALRAEKRLRILAGADHQLSASKDMAMAMQAAADWLVRHLKRC